MASIFFKFYSNIYVPLGYSLFFYISLISATPPRVALPTRAPYGRTNDEKFWVIFQNATFVESTIFIIYVDFLIIQVYVNDKNRFHKCLRFWKITPFSEQKYPTFY